jgi:methylthioribose-1-phosphate isomerase
LADAGISVRHIVDSGAYAKAKNILEHDNHKSILFLTGADVITNKGDLINKIGTCQISLGLNSLGIKHYVMTIASKIDAVDRNWNLDKIELRSPDEIWISKDKNIKD